MSERGQGFLPGRHAIDAVGPGGFRFADMSHQGSIFILPSGIHAWPVQSAAEFTVGAFSLLFEESKVIDFLLIGTGKNLIRLPDALLWRFREAKIQTDPMPTLAAARTYNVLVAENRRVAAALIALPASVTDE